MTMRTNIQRGRLTQAQVAERAMMRPWFIIAGIMGLGVDVSNWGG